jgi:hypothetical protein
MGHPRNGNGGKSSKPDFFAAFLEAKVRVRVMDFRFVEQSDQTLSEPLTTSIVCWSASRRSKGRLLSSQRTQIIRHVAEFPDHLGIAEIGRPSEKG